MSDSGTCDGGDVPNYWASGLQYGGPYVVVLQPRASIDGIGSNPHLSITGRTLSIEQGTVAVSRNRIDFTAGVDAHLSFSLDKEKLVSVSTGGSGRILWPKPRKKDSAQETRTN